MKKGKGKFITFSILLLSLFFGSIADAQVQKTILGNVAQPIYTLTVTGSGAGTGTVTGSINCTSTAGVESGICSQQYPMGTIVTLTPTAASGSMFNEWVGGGSGLSARTVVVSGNNTVDANFIIMPEGDSLLAWYKVNEGSGITILNSAPAGPFKFGDLTVSIGPNFWSTYPGFGYWDGATTNVLGTFTNLINPFDGPDGPITWVYFARAEIHTFNGTWGYLVQLRTGFAAFASVFFKALSPGRFRVDAGMASTAGANIEFSPGADYLERRFFSAVRNAGAAGTQTIAWVKFGDPVTGYSTVGWTEEGAGSNFNAVHLGYDSLSPTAEEVWKGVIGDVLVWKKHLTDVQIDQVFTALGSRWGF